MRITETKHQVRWHSRQFTTDNSAVPPDPFILTEEFSPMLRRHSAIDPQHTMLRGSAGCAVTANFSEYQLSKAVPGRRS